MIRKILGVIAGYTVFVVTSVLFFRFTGVNPHAESTFNFKMLTAAYGFIFSVIGGYVLQIIAKTENLNLNNILAFIIAGFATFSLVKADGAHWTQQLAIFIFAPASILGGFIYLRRNKI